MNTSMKITCFDFFRHALALLSQCDIHQPFSTPCGAWAVNSVHESTNAHNLIFCQLDPQTLFQCKYMYICTMYICTCNSIQPIRSYIHPVLFYNNYMYTYIHVLP